MDGAAALRIGKILSEKASAPDGVPAWRTSRALVSLDWQRLASMTREYLPDWARWLHSALRHDWAGLHMSLQQAQVSAGGYTDAGFASDPVSAHLHLSRA